MWKLKNEGRTRGEFFLFLFVSNDWGGSTVTLERVCEEKKLVGGGEANNKLGFRHVEFGNAFILF